MSASDSKLRIENTLKLIPDGAEWVVDRVCVGGLVDVNPVGVGQHYRGVDTGHMRVDCSNVEQNPSKIKPVNERGLLESVCGTGLSLW